MLDQPITQSDTATLAALLREGRQAKQWTLREAAAHTGVSNGYLSLMEKGDVKAPSPRYLRSVATHYELSYDRLMALAGHPSGEGPALTGGTAAELGARARPRTTGGPFRSAELDTESSEGGENTGDQHTLDAPHGGAPVLTGSPRVASRVAGPLATSGPQRARAFGRHDVDRSHDWEALLQLVAEDLSGLSVADVAQVRAFIAGMRAARR